MRHLSNKREVIDIDALDTWRRCDPLPASSSSSSPKTTTPTTTSSSALDKASSWRKRPVEKKKKSGSIEAEHNNSAQWQAYLPSLQREYKEKQEKARAEKMVDLTL